MPPGDYGAYSYSGILEVARGVRAGQVDGRRRRSPTRSARAPSTTTTRASSGGGPATTSPSRTCGSSRAAGPARSRASGGFMDIVAKIPASEEHGPHLRRKRATRRSPAGAPPPEGEEPPRLRLPWPTSRSPRSRPGLHRPGAGDDLRPARHRPVADLRAHDGGELLPRRALHAGRVLRLLPSSGSATSFWVALRRGPASWSARSASPSSASSSGGSTDGARTTRCC